MCKAITLGLCLVASGLNAQIARPMAEMNEDLRRAMDSVARINAANAAARLANAQAAAVERMTNAQQQMANQQAAAASPSPSSRPTTANPTSKDFAESCIDERSMVCQALLVGFVTGVRANASAMKSEKLVCVPDAEVNGKTMRLRVAGWILDHLKDPLMAPLDGPAASILALARVYPCPAP